MTSLKPFFILFYWFRLLRLFLAAPVFCVLVEEARAERQGRKNKQLDKQEAEKRRKSGGVSLLFLMSACYYYCLFS